MKKSDQEYPDRRRTERPQRLAPLERRVQHHGGQHQTGPSRNNIGNGTAAPRIRVALFCDSADEVRNRIAAEEASHESECKCPDHDLPPFESRVSTGISAASTMRTISSSPSGWPVTKTRVKTRAAAISDANSWFA